MSFLSEVVGGVQILRIYKLRLGDGEEEEHYYPTQELETFSFMIRKELEEFMVKLPQLNAIELLMLMNPKPSIFN